MRSAVLQMRGGVERDRFGKGAGKGPLAKVEHAPCIAVVQDTTLFVYDQNRPRVFKMKWKRPTK